MSYEAFAYYYDSLMDQEFYNDYIQFINKHVKKYQTVLELGCGTGEIMIRLAHLENVCATDISKICSRLLNISVLILKQMSCFLVLICVILLLIQS